MTAGHLQFRSTVPGSCWRPNSHRTSRHGSSQSATARKPGENPGSDFDCQGATSTCGKSRSRRQIPSLSRQALVQTRSLVQGEIQEQSIANGTLFRIALQGQQPASHLDFRLGAQFVEPELSVVVDNRNSPPLEIESVTVRWVPPVLGFVAPLHGAYTLRFGNAAALAPNYDLTALSAKLRRVGSSVTAGPIEPNPNYRRPESLPLLEPLAGAIDVGPWQYRAAVRMSESGIQRITLPAVVLSHADPSSKDLRLVREGHQIPYLVERTAPTQELHPILEPIANEKEPELSRWRLKLPFDALPLKRLSCRAKTRTLFERSAVLFDEARDERGNQARREVGRAIWRHTGSEAPPDLTLDLVGKVASSSLLLEVENGDNLPLALESFVLQLAVTQLVFKAAPGPESWLYYGNPKALAPRYDLGFGLAP